MRIIILGAGRVGFTLAENLASEAEITVVDHRISRLQEIRDKLDVATIEGQASYPDVLAQAGAEDADMLVAVTNSDETNMIACQIAYSLFQTPTKIARVRGQNYHDYPQLFHKNHLAIDFVISPELLVTRHIEQLIHHPGSLQVLDFANGTVQLVAVKAVKGGLLVGHELSELKQHMPDIKIRVAAIFRQDQSIIPQGNTVIEDQDEVFFVATAINIKKMMSELRGEEGQYRRIMIAGGGNIGASLAKSLESDFQVKIIEHNIERCRLISQRLDNTVVLAGDAAEMDMLVEENIEETDVFCAVTNSDEANIMSGLLAKKLGARKVIALVQRSAYVDMLEESKIDVAISPQLITTGALLSHIRRGDIVNVHSLRRGAAEAIEVIAHGDSYNSKVVGKIINDINLPPGTTIGAIVRQGEVLIPHGQLEVKPEDHLLMFLVDKKHIHHVEQLFQVGLSFF